MPAVMALGERAAAVPGRRRGVLAVRRRPVADAGVDGRLTSGRRTSGFNYGLVFLGWGIAFFVPQAAGYIKDVTGSLDPRSTCPAAC